jgi:drug/metabolite transporter, DME family
MAASAADRQGRAGDPVQTQGKRTNRRGPCIAPNERFSTKRACRSGTIPGMTPNPLRGVGMVLLAALCWGTTGTANSFSPSSFSAYWVGALRLLVSALFFGAVVAIGQRRQAHHADRPAVARASFRGSSVIRVLGAGISMAAYNLAFFAGVRHSGVAVGTAVALGSGPIWAGLLQALAGQRAPARWWAGTALAVAGGAVMVSSQATAGPTSARAIGLLLCLAAGLSYAVYALLSKDLVQDAAPEVVTLSVFGTAAALALPAAWWLAGPPALAWREALVVGYLGVVATGVAYLLFSHALRHISAATGVTLALAEPVTAFILAVTVVGERPGWLAAGGGLLVLVGLVFVVVAELRGSPAAAAATTTP